MKKLDPGVCMISGQQVTEVLGRTTAVQHACWYTIEVSPSSFHQKYEGSDHGLFIDPVNWPGRFTRASEI